ncbi:MAG: DNA-3-methyladenine glycosylase [Oscillospiraceae bacterium]|nr:DNA-3-methyladenine glycosylase [Oscillospiraceae bacterium]
MQKLSYDFFKRDCLEVAPELIGKIISRRFEDGTERRLRITETEAYRGEEDSACHARAGKTKRTIQLYRESGVIYVYLCYGVHWMLNIVTGEKENPQAVLIRACENYNGPGKLTKQLGITGRFNGGDIVSNPCLSIEDDGSRFNVATGKRVGINYADEADRNRLWRFILK